MGWVISASLLAMLAGLLLSAAIEDIRRREIANWKNAAIALLAPLWWWANGLALWPDAGVQFLAALLVFALFCGAFALGWMGGGDVKLIGALALWLSPPTTLRMLVVMSIIGGALTIAMMIERAIRRENKVIEVPYGVAIAVAGLLALREPILNQFP